MGEFEMNDLWKNRNRVQQEVSLQQREWVKRGKSFSSFQ